MVVVGIPAVSMTFHKPLGQIHGISRNTEAGQNMNEASISDSSNNTNQKPGSQFAAMTNRFSCKRQLGLVCCYDKPVFL